MTKQYDLITILGPTASGKTALAVNLAKMIGGEVISADSRQLYRGMDIGTGKDLNAYFIDGVVIPYHLVDIAEPGETYDLYRFVKDFREVFEDIRKRGVQPVMCGGSGMYLEAVIQGYNLNKAAENPGLRKQWEQMNDDQLVAVLKKLRPLHNTTDTRDRNRIIRALEIAVADRNSDTDGTNASGLTHLVIGIDVPRGVIRKKITDRLHARLEEGLVDEVQNLLDAGVPPDKLRYYGLEYRYVTDYITGMIDYNALVSLLNTAIHQFAKRQMTWFRRMEKKNILIHWINGDQDVSCMLRDAAELF
jgi:tRNA dimethylallyltransferase